MQPEQPSARRKAPRILMVIHTPWTPNLGGPRVQLELADELRAMGHEVEKFSYEDAFPRAAPRRESAHEASPHHDGPTGPDIGPAARSAPRASMLSGSCGSGRPAGPNSTPPPFSTSKVE